MALVVSFDVGQTLLDLDMNLLAATLADWGHHASAASLEAAREHALVAYDLLAREQAHPWVAFMTRLLEHAAIGAASPEISERLFARQLDKNLWRAPIADMVELVAELEGLGVPMGVISNSEGKVRELLEEVGLARRFSVIVDSGRVGFAKPDRRIFDLFAHEMATSINDVIHIGDSVSADVEGAVGAGAMAIWFDRKAKPSRERSGDDNRSFDGDARVRVAATAHDVRTALTSFGVVGLSDRPGLGN